MNKCNNISMLQIPGWMLVFYNNWKNSWFVSTDITIRIDCSPEKICFHNGSVV